MQVTYTKTTTTTYTEEFTAPRYWSCFTSATNTSLRKKAETCIRKIEKANGDRFKVKRAVFIFLKGWAKMCNSDRHSDAGVSDTAVREVVRGFAEDALRASGVFCDPYSVECDIYNDVESLPRSELMHRSQKK
jgi:hypothetical protein